MMDIELLHDHYKRRKTMTKEYSITQEKFDEAFEETMMYYKDGEQIDPHVLNNLLPTVLGFFEAAPQSTKKEKR